MQCYSSAIVIALAALFVVDCNCNTSTSTFIKPCDHPDCLKNLIQSAIPGFIKGYPELGIQSLDPFVVDSLKLLLPGGLQLEFMKGNSRGLRKCIVDSAIMVEDTIEIQFRCNLTIKGKYKSSGRLLMFAIDGDGDSMIKCKNIKIQCSFKLDSLTGEDGQKYLTISDFKVNHTYDGQVIYRMTNLIRGNTQISNVILNFMNRNWRLVAEEFGKPIVDFGVSNVLANVKKLFSIVPMNHIITVTN